MKKPVGLTEAKLRRLMRDDEGMNLEYKEGLLSRKEISEYAVGIGNEGGGWLVMGVTDKKPRRIVGIKEPAFDELQKIGDAVLNSAGIRVDLEPIRATEGFVLAIGIPSRPKGQIFYTRTGKYLMRTGEGLRGMPLDEIERIRSRELEKGDYTAELVHPDWKKVVDPIELQRLKKLLQENRREELGKLADEDLLRSLEVLVARKGRFHATRAAVLLLGTPEAIRTYAPHHEVKFQRFGADELAPTFSEDNRGPILAIAQRASEVMQVANSVESFQAGLFRVDVPKFPPPAYREAVANALIHRDYKQSGNVAVRIYANRLEVGSPGGWFGGVNETNILVTESQRRNELLASVLQRIGLAERSALGVKRMYQVMLNSGKESPEYRSSVSSVTVILRDGTFDKEFAALADRCTREGVALSVFDLLVLSYLRRHRDLTVKDAASICQQSQAAARRILDELRNRKLVDRRGEGKGRSYVLGSLAYESLSLTGERPRDLGMSETRLEGLLLEELERRKNEGLTNREVREWSHYGRAQTTRILQSLVAKGRIVTSGKRGRGSRYWLPPFAPGGLKQP